MNYKLVAVDLDDSLLGYDHKISAENKAAIKKTVDKGVIFTIATGRPLQSCLPFVKELGLDVPFITYNGALVIKGKSMEILYHKTIEPEDASDILEEAVEYSPTILVFNDNKLYVNELNERTQRYSKLSNMSAYLEKDLKKITKNGPTKVLLYHEPDQVKRIYYEIKDRLEGKVNFHISKPFFLEFIHKEVSKGNALAALAKNMGIDPKEVIAIGDSYNDISMIEYAGLGVAVENAYEDIKNKADYICKSNVNHGVAQVLEKFVLEG
jgi:hypothetical protein